MSLCVAFIMNDEVYICSESRSSAPDYNSGTNPFTKRPNKSTPLEDNFKKIFKVPIGGHTIIGFATGDNTFGQKPITKIIQDICYSHCNSPIDCCSAIMQKLSEFRGMTYINLFECSGRDIVRVSGILDDEKIDISKDIIRGEKDEIIYFYSGPQWAKALLYSVPFSPTRTENERITAINGVYEAALKVSKTLENTLGGPIHIGKLTPEGFFWLQNGYEL